MIVALVPMHPYIVHTARRGGHCMCHSHRQRVEQLPWSRRHSLRDSALQTVLGWLCDRSNTATHIHTMLRVRWCTGRAVQLEGELESAKGRLQALQRDNKALRRDRELAATRDAAHADLIVHHKKLQVPAMMLLVQVQ